ncbi:hypothetical protein C8N36_105179 [Pelagimonas varians]|uniref:Uncharacterized protein n=2 Tax=Pelagimonas varians TaxID=696760 RepID=A0A238KA05_9RHOB|nr:hypothetical protein C8N36_105179 [Pelagimonas varians]SMX39679.1 hypothetical protein PEV8663_01819 [Pelagimonas varians]
MKEPAPRPASTNCCGTNPQAFAKALQFGNKGIGHRCPCFILDRSTVISKPTRNDPLDPAPAAAYGRFMTNDSAPKKKKPKNQKVYTLLVEIGRKDGDGLPKGSTGAALMCYASGVDEAEAVRETVAILKQADTAPLDVTGYGTIEERREQGHDIADDEIELMDRALRENSVIVAQVTPFFDKA